MAKTKRRGFFKGLAKATATGARAPFISRVGTVLYRVIRVNAGENRTGEPYWHMDVEAVHKLADGVIPDTVQKMNIAAEKAGKDPILLEGAHEAGERVAWRVKVSGENRDSQLGNILNAAQALCESLEVDYDSYDDDDWDTAIFDEESGLAGESQPCSGIFLVGTTDARVSKKDTVYTVTTWSPGDDVAMDLVDKGHLPEDIFPD